MDIFWEAIIKSSTHPASTVLGGRPWGSETFSECGSPSGNVCHVSDSVPVHPWLRGWPFRRQGSLGKNSFAALACSHIYGLGSLGGVLTVLAKKERQEALGADLRQDPNLGPLLLGPGPRPVLSVSVVLWAEGLRTLSSQVKGLLTLSLVLTTRL